MDTVFGILVAAGIVGLSLAITIGLAVEELTKRLERIAVALEKIAENEEKIFALGDKNDINDMHA
ncbi:MAG: hypothetical protein A3B99_05520 [Candidatus Yanofskybacteria bacterium RIFCSPHIGHO2_02_FULL_44_12b]|uniref:Uncharacterized protein n=1 Tax=Candidatus Yanofskybacteria bacterium GW2011_GWA2_44_9 TaxID=1619025 RepID=A0A0G1KB36_9BACT|nr:MAG: hypothetical protein UW79_C0034G0001 [Candidatus Yanofskybacteria bacterium GW2011_GWA2_44_9]OGN04930.1 MAG: hypothetical protein A2659_00005 [Candidatus Yanofskybacteria bacterium RIFCSPHIGHO2_01_FULL_44_24]OGN16150.1 MAG: hypothetical protein A3B99_05520 [Candidatus Yanofskybacteria bacterium RIFCSPHIGHO2_02_FULL_44_12b]